MALNQSGEFIKADMFESLWIQREFKDNYDALQSLNDDDYIDYYLWEDINCERMYKKHKPNTGVYRGKNPNIIFHGGCLGCKSQRIHGFDRCKGCMFFRSNSSVSLKIDGEDCHKISGDDFTKLLLGE